LETLELNTIPFQFALNLQGSQNLAFTPIGNVTTVELRSDWSSPSFNGNWLYRPDCATDIGVFVPLQEMLQC